MTSEGSQQITSCLIPELNGHIPRTTGKNEKDQLDKIFKVSQHTLCLLDTQTLTCQA